MRSETNDKYKPEEMLLRVIRVAELLMKVQDDVPVKALQPESIHDRPDADICIKNAQKTQD